MPGQHRNILATFAERRQAQRHDVQAVEQVLAETAGNDFARQVAIGDGHDPHIDLDPFAAANPVEGLLLQHANDLALGFERHVGHFVEHQGAAMGLFEQADLALAFGGRLDAEQLHFHAFRMHGGAIDHDERTAGAFRGAVQQPRHHFLADPGRAGDQDPRTGRRHPVDRLPQLIHRRGDAEKFVLAAGPQPQFLDLTAQPGGFDGAFHRQQQPIGLERLFDEFVGALLDRRHGGLDGAVAAHHHHRHRWMVALDLGQDAQAVESAALQPDVQQHQAGAAGANRLDGGIAIGRVARLVAFVTEDPADQQADIGFVVDDEDVMGHGWSPCRSPRSEASHPE